jgi:hypothetical protein
MVGKPGQIEAEQGRASELCLTSQGAIALDIPAKHGNQKSGAWSENRRFSQPASRSLGAKYLQPRVERPVKPWVTVFFPTLALSARTGRGSGEEMGAETRTGFS